MSEIARVRYTHDAMIDLIISTPSISQNEMAALFGYSATWVSIIINSDAFQERLAARKTELTDPKLRASIEERLEALAKTALDRLIERLDTSTPAIRTSDLVSIAKLGVGDRANRPQVAPTQNNLYVVALPPPAQNTSSWLANRSAGAFSSPAPLVEVLNAA